MTKLDDLAEAVAALDAAQEEVITAARENADLAPALAAAVAALDQAIERQNTLIHSVQTRSLTPRWVVRNSTSASDVSTSVSELIWTARTWADVRPGDAVRMPGSATTAVVQSARTQLWHVDPQSSEYRPEALDHTIMVVVFRDDPTMRRMDPGKPVEILLHPDEVVALDAAGWMNRALTTDADR